MNRFASSIQPSGVAGQTLAVPSPLAVTMVLPSRL